MFKHKLKETIIMSKQTSVCGKYKLKLKSACSEPNYIVNTFIYVLITFKLTLLIEIYS